MGKKLLGTIAFFFFLSSVVKAQTIVRENDFTSKVFKNKIEISSENNTLDYNSVKAYDAFTNEVLTISKTDKISINTHPSQIVKVEYLGKNNVLHTSYLAAPSLSTGEIKVYFNHPVDNSVAQTENAVNLGNTLDDKLIEKINACTNTLDIAIYNSSSPSATTGIAGALNAAHARGVQIRLIYDGSTTSSMLGFLDPAIPLLASPNNASYGIMHNKFVIFDANDIDPNKPLVWTGSTNWTVPQIDGPDKNNVITVQDQALALGYKLEFEEMWGSATMTPNLTTSKFGPFKTDNTPHNYIIGGKVIENYFSPSDGANSRIINTLNSANSDINIATMVITRNDIATTIINKYNSGIVNTNVVLDTQNPTGNQFSNIQSSIASGHAVLDVLTGILHHKFVVVDNYNAASDPQVLTGSHNWSSSAETKNDENILIVHDANIANQYYQAFYYLYNQASGTLNVNNSDAINETFTVYPNPSNGYLYVKNSTGNVLDNVTVSIYDMVGNTVYSNTVNLINEQIIDLTQQSSGIYLIELKANNKIQHYKLVKN